jgi:hypothetical protein
MSEETKSEFTEDQKAAIKIVEKRFDAILNMIGLSTPIDYIFLDFAIQKSRLTLSNIGPNLQFLFHTISRTALLGEGRVFPNSMFIEEVPIRKFDESLQTTVDSAELVMWSLAPSSQWQTRDVLPFTDFHLYFNEVIKPLYNYSAEDIYRLFDDKKEDLYFVTHGTRESTESKKIITLFVTRSNIIVFHFDPVDVEKIPKTEKFASKWISLEYPICIKEINEYAVFERPKFQLVPDTVMETEPIQVVKKEEFNFSTKGLDYVEDMDCLNCSS